MKHYCSPVVEVLDKTLPYEICTDSAGFESFNELGSGTELWENE